MVLPVVQQPAAELPNRVDHHTGFGIPDSCIQHPNSPSVPGWGGWRCLCCFGATALSTNKRKHKNTILLILKQEPVKLFRKAPRVLHVDAMRQRTQLWAASPSQFPDMLAKFITRLLSWAPAPISSTRPDWVSDRPQHAVFRRLVHHKTWNLPPKNGRGGTNLQESGDRRKFEMFTRPPPLKLNRSA